MIHLMIFLEQTNIPPSLKKGNVRHVERKHIFRCFSSSEGVENVFIYDNENILCMFWQI